MSRGDTHERGLESVSQCYPDRQLHFGEEEALSWEPYPRASLDRLLDVTSLRCLAQCEVWVLPAMVSLAGSSVPLDVLMAALELFISWVEATRVGLRCCRLCVFCGL